MDKRKQIRVETAMGTVTGYEAEGCAQFLGIPYAKAERFRYAKPVTSFEDGFDAAEFGNTCPSFRQYYPHLENPERLFYYREFREGQTFTYDEDCLNLNIFAPLKRTGCPVAVFIHGGGFNSGGNSEEPFRGYELAKRGILTVFINYRVGILGYLTHEDIEKEYGRDGNFGLDDQRIALLWVKEHIADFGGDPNNITLFGQSAGAMSIQYLCLDENNKGLFQRVYMISGAGLFPEFASPRKAETTREYWLELMEYAGCSSLEELRTLDIRSLSEAVEHMKLTRKDTLYNTMPVIDGLMIKAPVKELIKKPLPIGYMISYTNNDMYAPLMARIGNEFGRKNNAYICFFDVDAPGDANGAFHSCDLRYLFGRLAQSWRPYTQKDYEISDMMMDYFAAYAKTGNPNAAQGPYWQPCHDGKARVLCIRKDTVSMGRVPFARLSSNMIRKGSPKA